VPVVDGEPPIVNEEPVTVPLTPAGKLPSVMEIVAELVAVYTIVIIAVFGFTFWLAVPLLRVMVGSGISLSVGVPLISAGQKAPPGTVRALYVPASKKPLKVAGLPLPSSGVPTAIPSLYNW
jgi:hypothetical protein